MTTSGATASSTLASTSDDPLQAWLPTVARVVYGLPYLAFGGFHFMAGPQMAGMVPVPGGVFWVYLTGAAMIAASISIMTGKLARVAAPLLALLVATFAFTLYLPNVGAEGQAGQSAMTGFLKDLALVGGALLAWVDALRRP